MASAVRTKQPVITLDELKSHPIWRDLTVRQQTMVESWIFSGDRVFAVRSAYNVKSAEVARVLSYEFFASPNVRSALNLFYGVTERDERDRDERKRKEFFDKLQRRILQGKVSIADAEMVKLVCQQRGWTTPINLPSGKNGYIPVSRRHVVGEVVTQDGVKYRVTEVNTQGKILSADPVTE